MYQHLIDRADRRLAAVKVAKCIIVGGPVVAIVAWIGGVLWA
jgi:hypothetical protein